MIKISRPHVKWSIKKIIILVVLFFATGLILYFIRMNGSPNEAKIKVGNVESTASSSERQIPLSTSYFDLLYPDKYKMVADQPSTDYLLSYKTSSPEKQSLQVTLRKADKGGIVLDEDYQEYSKQPDNYKMSNTFFGSEAIDFATNKKGGEQIALWLHDKYVLVIKMKDNLKEPELDKQLRDLLSSVQWK